jgi:hypothetical protein
MITFYDDDTVCVTDQWFINGHRQYQLIACTMLEQRTYHQDPP